MIFILNNIKSRSLLEKITASINDTFQIIPVYIDINSPIKQLFDLRRVVYSSYFLSSIIGDKVIKEIPIEESKTSLARWVRMRTKSALDYIPFFKFILNKIHNKNLLLCSMENRFGKYGSNSTSLYIIDELDKNEFNLLDKQCFTEFKHDKFIISTEKNCELGEATIVVSESDTLDAIKKKLEVFNNYKFEIDLNTQEGFDKLYDLIKEEKEPLKELPTAATKEELDELKEKLKETSGFYSSSFGYNIIMSAA